MNRPDTSPCAFTNGDTRYSVLRELGRGGMGITYEVKRESDGKRFALKELRLERAESWKAVELFEREAGALRSLDHPGIPRYVDAFQDDEGMFVQVQSFVPGKTLADSTADHEVLSPQLFERYLRQCIEILAYLHDRVPPVVHRDVTPSNVMVDGERAYLIDFGSVKVALRDSTTMTSVGTFGFMSPEHILGRPIPASDMFSLGMTFISLATGCDPSDMPTDPRSGAVDPSSILHLGEPVRSILLKMINPGIEDRLHVPQEALGLLEGSILFETESGDDPLAPLNILESSGEPTEISGEPTAEIPADDVPGNRLQPVSGEWGTPTRKPGRNRLKRIAVRGSATLGGLFALTLIGGWVSTQFSGEHELRTYGGWFSGHGNVVGSAEATILRDIYLADAAAIETTALSPDGETLATYARDGMILWDVDSGKLLARHDGMDRWNYDPHWASFSDDGAVVVMAQWNGTVTTSDPKTAKSRRHFELDMLVHNEIGDQSTTFRAARALSETDVRVLLLTTKQVSDTRWSARASVVDVVGQQVMTQCPVSWDHIEHGALSRDGQRFAISGYQRLDPNQPDTYPRSFTLGVYEVGGDCTPLMLHENPNWGHEALAFDGGGKTLMAMGNRDVTLWDIASGERLTSIGIEPASYWSELAVDEAGEVLAINGRDRVDVYDVGTGYHVATMRGHDTRITSVELSRDGKFLVSGSRDQTAKLWAVPGL